jgi:hypothetical protein
MPIYFGDKNITEIYFGNNRIGEVYYGNVLVYSSWKDVYLTTPGLRTYNLPKGKYKVTMRGSGGAGGQASSNNGWNGTIASGGAGGYGTEFYEEIEVTTPTQITVFLGEAGTPFGSANCNGGAGNTFNGVGGNSGGGGGGAKPSYIFFETGRKIVVQGGGGGGGGGLQGSGPGRRSRGGPGGGGGGGYYITAEGSIVPIQGKTGAMGPSYYNLGSAGQNGEQNYGGSGYSAGRGGGGSHYQTGAGGAGGVGFGASGGAGNSGDRNNHTHKSSRGGAGGGGAPGGSTACGGGTGVAINTAPTAGTNFSIINPGNAAVQTWNEQHGIPANAGKGGNGGSGSSLANGAAGQNGCIKIERVYETPIEAWDFGSVADSTIDETFNAESVTDETITQTEDLGVL